MSPHLEIGIEGALGIITLNRPQAINALDHAMIAGIHATLAGWAGDNGVRAVLIEGRGPRGFCAGGDVRAVRALVLEGKQAEAEAFFTDEYALNGLVATYAKPVVALTHGAVMGGGIGLAGHAQFRFSLPDVKFAMPESAIGFVVDTGVNAILAMAPAERALLFLLTGLPVGAADALTLGLTDCVIGADRAEAVRTGIILAANADNIGTSIVALMQAESRECGEAEFCASADSLAGELKADSAAAIVASIAQDGPAAMFAAVLRQRSPASLEAILQSHRAARRGESIAVTLERDGRLARWMIGRPDFAEGVRAVLVDKDMRARWQPPQLDAQDAMEIKKLI